MKWYEHAIFGVTDLQMVEEYQGSPINTSIQSFLSNFDTESGSVFNVCQFWDISRCTMFRPTKKSTVISISGVSFSVVFHTWRSRGVNGWSFELLSAIESHNLTCHVQGCHSCCLTKFETNKNLLNDVRSMTSKFMCVAISANVTFLGWWVHVTL